MQRCDRHSFKFSYLILLNNIYMPLPNLRWNAALFETVQKVNVQMVVHHICVCTCYVKR